MHANPGDLIEIIAPRRRDAPAILHDDGVITWAELGDRSNALGRALLARGIQPGDRVAFFLFNGPDYLEWLVACWKARLVHANINYRYVRDEVDHLLTDSAATVLVFDHRLAGEVPTGSVADGLLLVQIGGSEPAIDGAVLMEGLVTGVSDAPLEVQRSGDDQVFIYTGGTTGYPKGVIWRWGDMLQVIFGAEIDAEHVTTGLIAEHTANEDRPQPYRTGLVASPLMHGAGLWMAVTMLCNGNTAVVCDNSTGFDAEAILATVDRHDVDGTIIVGDPFARPLIEAIEQHPERATSLRIIGSSGAIWSAPVKQRLLELLPGVVLLDLLASTEAASVGSSAVTDASELDTGQFTLGANCRVFDDNDQPVAPGSGIQGRLAVGGPQPLGYHNDPDKTAATFRTIDGVRYSFPGDVCTVEADGSIQLLGRGSGCINTAGEKVFPEEVEEVLKTHPGVVDSLVFGVEDAKWGQAVMAVVAAGDDADEAELRSYLKDGRLAGYKVPKRILVVDHLERKANGKADYPAAKARMAELLAQSSQTI